MSSSSRSLGCLFLLLVCAYVRLAAQAEPPARHPAPPPVDSTATETLVKVVGVGVTPPHAIYAPDPEYSEEALKAHRQGVGVLQLDVGSDGSPRNIKVIRSVGMGLDERAVEKVSTWRFDPARKDSKPVAVQITVEVSFRLYSSPELTAITDRAFRHDAEAEMALAHAYNQGRDISGSESEGWHWTELAARDGSPEAQFLMGKHKLDAAKHSGDYVPAYIWFSLAQRGGYKKSNKMLAEVSLKIPPEQLTNAQARVQAWIDAHPR